MSANVKILVAGHKSYWVPDDSMYVPVQAGAEGKHPIEGWQLDNAGDNISTDNPRYCELTVLYWGWKNLSCDYLGLAHYRRHFAGKGTKGVMTHGEAIELLQKAPVILPKKRHYVIETVGNHYAHTFSQEHLDILRATLESLSPQTVPFFNKHLSERSAHIWNMAIMRRDIMDAWCSWLFPVLEVVEECIDFTAMSDFEARVLGRLSERLLDPWLAEQGIDFVEVPVVSLEGENLVKKATGVLQAKFLGKKYTKSY